MLNLNMYPLSSRARTKIVGLMPELFATIVVSSVIQAWFDTWRRANVGHLCILHIDLIDVISTFPIIEQSKNLHCL